MSPKFLMSLIIIGFAQQSVGMIWAVDWFRNHSKNTTNLVTGIPDELDAIIEENFPNLKPLSEPRHTEPATKKHDPRDNSKSSDSGSIDSSTLYPSTTDPSTIAGSLNATEKAPYNYTRISNYEKSTEISTDIGDDIYRVAKISNKRKVSAISRRNEPDHQPKTDTDGYAADEPMGMPPTSPLTEYPSTHRIAIAESTPQIISEKSTIETDTENFSENPRDHAKTEAPKEGYNEKRNTTATSTESTSESEVYHTTEEKSDKKEQFTTTQATHETQSTQSTYKTEHQNVDEYSTQSTQSTYKTEHRNADEYSTQSTQSTHRTEHQNADEYSTQSIQSTHRTEYQNADEYSTQVNLNSTNTFTQSPRETSNDDDSEEQDDTKLNSTEIPESKTNVTEDVNIGSFHSGSTRSTLNGLFFTSILLFTIYY